jgi:hypothetical protein
VTRAILVAVGMLGALVTPASPVAVGACAPGWTPIAGPGGGIANDVSAIDADSAWYVAYAPTPGDNGWVESYDGTSWSPVAFPRPGDSERINAVTAIADDDVWVVGQYYDPVLDENGAYAAHWDGEVFTRFPIEAGDSPSITDVDAIATDDVWAVGSHRVDGRFRTLALHWDGLVWSEVATGAPPVRERSLFGVEVISPTNGWAVGNSYKFGAIRPLALHWNGQDWRRTQLPDVGTNNPGLFGVSGNVARRVWAVGQVDNGARTLITRWDGTSWTVVPSPNPDDKYNSLAGIAELDANHTWAVGGRAAGRPLLMRWDGAAWRVVKAPGGTEKRTFAAIEKGVDGSMVIVGTDDEGHGVALQRCPAA